MIQHTVVTSKIVIKGLHYENLWGEGGSYEQEVVTLEIDGQEYDRLWTPDTRMEPYYLDIMLDDMGVGKVPKDAGGTEDQIKAEREAVKNYCLQLLKELELEERLTTLSEIQTAAHAFWDGYQKAIYGSYH